MMRASPLFQRESFLFFIAITASMLLSTWIGYREATINPDAICYLLSAEIIGKAGISGAMHLCGQAEWPFYSTLIYGFVKISHLSYASAAYILDGFFSLLSVVMFILIVKELGASRRVLWLSALVILCSHEFNSVREYIVRDHGFWAFYLTSILFLLQYFREPSWMRAFAWSISMLIAALFRIEGAIFLLAVPFASWLYSKYSLRERASAFFTLNLVLILIGLAISSWLLLHPQQTLSKLGRLVEVPDQLQHGMIMMSERYQSTKAALAHYVLSPDSAKEAGVILFIVLMAWYAISVIGNLSWIYAALVVYAWIFRAAFFSSRSRLVLMAYLGINVVVTFGFLTEHLFLTKRYLIALSLVLMLWVPFALDKLLQKRNRLTITFVAICIFISTLSGIFDFGYSKSYIRDAGDWLATNVPAKASLYANDNQLMYYSKHFGDSIFEKYHSYSKIETIAHGQWKQYDYIALRLGKRKEDKEIAVLEEMHLQPIQIFSNKRGDKVLIFEVHPSQSDSHLSESEIVKG